MSKLSKIALILSTLLLGMCAGAASAQTPYYAPAVPLVCTQGAGNAVTAGLNSTNTLLTAIPACTVTVYLTGTSTLAVIYSNSTGTALSNPFTAPGNGLFAFYAASGGYDVTLSGTNMTTTTLANVAVGAAGGGGNGLPSCTAGQIIAYIDLGSGPVPQCAPAALVSYDGTASDTILVINAVNGGIQTNGSLIVNGNTESEISGGTTLTPQAYGGNRPALTLSGANASGTALLDLTNTIGADLGGIDSQGNTVLPSLILTGISTTPNASPICPNGTGGRLTTVGCTGSGGGGAISGTFTHLGQIGSGGNQIIDSNLSLLPPATFTATVTGSALSAIVVTSGTPTVGQVVYSSSQTLPLVLTAYNSGAATGTLNTSATNGTNVAFTAHGSTLNPQAFQPKSINGVFQSSQIAPVIGGKSTSTVTSYSIASNVLTLTGSFGSAYPAATNFALGTFPTSTFLNGQILTVVTSSSTTLTAAFTHANVGTTTEAGMVTNSGIQTALLTPDCTAFGCYIFQDPFDQNTSLPLTGWTPNSTVQTGPGAFCFSANVCEQSNMVQNGNYNNAALQAAGGKSYGTDLVLNATFNWDGYVGSNNAEGVIDNGISLNYSSHTAGSIDNILSIFNQNAIAKPGDVNIDNINLYLNNAAIYPGDEGDVGHRLYMNEYGTMGGTVAAGTGAGSQTLRFVSTSNGTDIADGTSLVDTSAGVLTGTVSFTLNTSVTVPTGALAIATTTGMTYGASVQGNVVAQANIQGLLFATTSTASSATAVNVLFSTAGSLSYTCSSSSNNIVVNIVPGTTTLANIVTLFSGGGCVTLAGGITSVSLGYSASGSTLATTYTTALPLSGLSILSPATTTFAMYSPSAPTTTALLSLITGYGSQFIYPSTVVYLGNGIYAITAPLRQSQTPGLTCQGGLVGGRLELPDLTSVSAGTMVTQKIYCSPVANSTIYVGEISAVGMAFLNTTFTYNANIYSYAAQIISVADPLQTTNRQVSFGNYAYVEAYATGGGAAFAPGDHVIDSFHFSETKVAGKTLLTCEGFNDICRGYDFTFNGPNFGKVFNIINSNPQTIYTDINPSGAVGVARPNLMSVQGQFGGIIQFMGAVPSSIFVQTSGSWPVGQQYMNVLNTVGGQILNCYAPMASTSDSVAAATALAPAILTLNGTGFTGGGACLYLPGMHIGLSGFTINTVLNSAPINYGTILTVSATRITVALSSYYVSGTIGNTVEPGSLSTPSFELSVSGAFEDLQLGTLNANAAISDLYVTQIGAPVASASSITPLQGIQHVTGTAAISVMSPLLGCTMTAQSCSIKLIPDAAWTITTGGGTWGFASATTAVVGKALECQGDPATTKWYCSY